MKGKGQRKFIFFLVEIPDNTMHSFLYQIELLWDGKNEADMSGSVYLGNCDSQLSLQRIENISKFSINWLYYILCPSISRQMGNSQKYSAN